MMNGQMLAERRKRKEEKENKGEEGKENKKKETERKGKKEIKNNKNGHRKNTQKIQHNQSIRILRRNMVLNCICKTFVAKFWGIHLCVNEA